MRKKAPLTVERKHSQGGVASEQTPHPSSCPPLAAYRPRPFRCSSFSHTNRFAGFAWEPCPFANPLKTTKKGAAAPFLGFPRGLVCAEFVFRLSKRATDASLIDRRGIRNTLRLFRVVLHGRPSVRDTRCSPCRKDGFSTSIRQIFNGRKRSDSHGVSCAWETRLNGRPKGVRTTACVTTKRRTERRAFQARQRYLASSGLFFHIFSAKTEKIWPAERRMRLRKLHRASGAFELHLRRHPTPSGAKKLPFPGLLLRAKLSTCGCGLFTNFLFTTAQQMFHKTACGQI